MRICVLGSVGWVDDNGRTTPIRSRKRRIVLACLVAAGGRVVTDDRLVDALWPTHPPVEVVSNLHNQVYRLRQSIGPDSVVREEAGYRLAVEASAIDAQHFERLAAEGQALADTDPETAVARLEAALACWHGEPYPGLDGDAAIDLQRTRLGELRLAVFESRSELLLRLGRHREVSSDVQAMLTEHPRRDRLRAALMLSLYRSGRAADALRTYREGRALLAEDIGIEPGPALRDLERAILAQDPALDLPAAGPSAPNRVKVPAELPAEPAAFTGRAAETAWLTEQLTDGAVIALNGPGGSGKSALALHAAHAVAERYPDGQLYADLRGAAPGVQAADTVEVLARFLRVLGERPPEDPAEASARFRSLTATRRILVVLDDAADAAQVRPLLPGGRKSAVVVTGRTAIATLDAVHRQVETLSSEDAVELLAELAGDPGIADTDAAAEIVRSCGRLPLAVRIAGARLAAQPGRRPAWLAERLADEHARLDELAHGDLAVRVTLEVGYDALSPEAAEVFALLGCLETPTVSSSLVAASGGLRVRPVERSLDQLIEAQLVQPAGEGGGYRMHDLVRLYARERAGEWTTTARDSAYVRAVHWYVATARKASQIVIPTTPERIEIGLPDAELQHAGLALRTHREVAEWVDAETENLLALVRQADRNTGTGPAGLTALAREFGALLVALHTPFWMRGNWGDFLRLGRLVQKAVSASAGAVDEHTIGCVERVIGATLCTVGDLDAAERLLESARDRFTRTGDRERQASVLNNMAVIALGRGRNADAIEHCTNALELLPDDRTLPAVRALLYHRAVAHRSDGRLAVAVDELTTVLDLNERIGDQHRETMTLAALADTYRLAGDHDAALDSAERALRTARTIGSRDQESRALWALGDVHAALQDRNVAQAYRRDSLGILRELARIDSDRIDALLAQPSPTYPGEAVCRSAFRR